MFFGHRTLQSRPDVMSWQALQTNGCFRFRGVTGFTVSWDQKDASLGRVYLSGGSVVVGGHTPDLLARTPVLNHGEGS